MLWYQKNSKIIVLFYKVSTYNLLVKRMKKKRIKEGLRNLTKNFVSEKELEENLKNEISSEIHNNRRKS